ncbi:MAG: putative capsular polysaccharide synthesis family protein [Xenococcaceae cyanobacterium MO_234.B1]|nr:putative capsular polysaccharide synthesis family protein [Xenococcaceae cyanobacterium MO_234.B1]
MDILKRVIPKPVKRLGRKWVDQLYFERQLRRATPVLVYQMGKVGSSSIYRSLLKQYAGVVLHSHSFSLNHEAPKIRRLFHWAIVNARPLKVISLTREPIGRNVSAFFQNFERVTGVPYAEANFSIKELKAIFLSNYKHEIPLKWFDNNILANFGIDVFSTPFPENGISTYSNNNIELLVMRLEISDNEKITAINNFLGLDRFQLHNTNIGKKKGYSKTYKAFTSKVKFSPDYIDKMCDSKYFNYFYSKEAINAARKKWSER